MVGTQPPQNSNKWWHLKREKYRRRKKSGGFFRIYLNFQKSMVKKQSHSWQGLCFTHKHKWVLCHTCTIHSTSLHVFPSNPVTPNPLLLCWQTALISSELGKDTLYLREKRVCPQQVNMQLPHPPSRQTRMTLFDTLPLIALWHAGRIKGGIFHMQLELKIKTMKCSVQRKAGDQNAVMKGD